ncbi:hypothetical protein [Halostella sp. PRR32]|uniref:hypothetical protein n=1 Tax=Halostella sp. PRR32 TaxID=3098147 RepID=UPI002B1CEAAC|nr:hypothetical protein [Halostella sp. PRR32]
MNPTHSGYGVAIPARWALSTPTTPTKPELPLDAATVPPVYPRSFAFASVPVSMFDLSESRTAIRRTSDHVETA